jgi:TolB-like protein/tetratricopeptide (TPR) repeat protein
MSDQPESRGGDHLLERLSQRLGPGLSIERELGGGGMSRVFLARDASLNRLVVLKVLHGAGEGVSLERFRREMLLAASLQHPHIVPVLAAGDLDGVPWYTMPWIEGLSLRDRLQADHQLPVRDALRILRDVARGCTYAHARGIVHRDIKPENILLTGDAAVIIDFGIAKALIEAQASAPHEAGLTRVGFTLGTPTYMAPEQAAADPTLDHRADLYALGVVAFELLAGRPPFQGTSSQQLLKAHLADPVPPLGEFRTAMPAGLVDLVNACLAKNPEDRPRDAEAVVERIEGLLSSASSEMPVVRPQTRWMAVAGVAAILLLGVLFLGGPRGPGAVAARASSSVAVLPFIARGDDSASAWLASGLSDDVAAQLLALGGLQVAPRLSVEQAGRSPLPPAELGETLGVQALLDGVVRREGGELRVIAQLVEASSGSILWTGSYRETPEQAGRIVDDIVGSVRGALITGASQTAAARSERDPAAYAEYLRGRALVQARTDTGIIAGVAALQRAVERDSTFAAAWAALADALLLLPLYAGVPAGEVNDDAERAVARALASAPDLPEALFTRGLVKRARWDWTGAEADFRLALRQAPMAAAEQALGEVLLVRGRPQDAHEAFARAQGIAPGSGLLAALSGVAAALAGREADARTALHAAALADSTSGTVLFLAGTGWLYLGDHAAGLRLLDRAAQLAPDQPLLRGIRAQALAQAGQAAEARRLRDGLIADRGRAGVAGGLVHAELGLGNVSGALDALERAVVERDPIFAAEPMASILFRDLANLPRFTAALDQVGVEGVTGGT